jgi:hypothetical protein
LFRVKASVRGALRDPGQMTTLLTPLAAHSSAMLSRIAKFTMRKVTRQRITA